MEKIKTVIIGAEYDKQLISKLEQLLLQEGVLLTQHQEGVAGSQDYQRYEVIWHGTRVTIEQETYTGISITGDAPVVDYIYTALQNGATGPMH